MHQADTTRWFDEHWIKFVQMLYLNIWQCIFLLLWWLEPRNGKFPLKKIAIQIQCVPKIFSFSTWHKWLISVELMAVPGAWCWFLGLLWRWITWRLEKTWICWTQQMMFSTSWFILHRSRFSLLQQIKGISFWCFDFERLFIVHQYDDNGSNWLQYTMCFQKGCICKPQSNQFSGWWLWIVYCLPWLLETQKLLLIQ